MNRIQSLARTARTPMTPDEKGAIKRSARMGAYAVAHVIAFLVWCVACLWVTMWAGIIVVPRMGRFVQEGLGVTSENAQSTEAFIAYWAAPLALIVIVLAAGIIAVCVLAWRARARMMRAVRRWVDRAVPAQDNDSDDSTAGRVGTAGAPLGTARIRTQRQRSRKR